MRNIAKFTIAATSLATVLAAGHALAGSPVTITGAGIYAPVTLDVSGYGSEWSSAIDLTVLEGGSATPSTLYAFCVDLSHEIIVNSPGTTDIVTAQNNNQHAQTLNYQTGALLTDSTGALSGTGAPLSSTQIAEIGDLAHLGGGLIYHDLYLQAHGGTFDGAALSNDLGAIQGAIWTIEYPTHTITAPDPTISALMAGYVAAANPKYAGSVTALYAVNGLSQGFVIGTPEPTTWALMLVGFGGVGALLRRRGRLAARA